MIVILTHDDGSKRLTNVDTLPPIGALVDGYKGLVLQIKMWPTAETVRGFIHVIESVMCFKIEAIIYIGEP